MKKLTLLLITALMTAVMALPASADPGKPDFGAALYADGEVFGTKGTTDLPPPTGANALSYDALVAITNGAQGQLPIAEAAPGNPTYNGGRWALTVWTWIGVGTAPLITSYGDFQMHVTAGHLVRSADHPDTSYFQCPLLPVKG